MKESYYFDRSNVFLLGATMRLKQFIFPMITAIFAITATGFAHADSSYLNPQENYDQDTDATKPDPLSVCKKKKRP